MTHTMKKAAAGLFILSLLSFYPVSQARAQSIEDLQRQITQLLATVAALQAQLAGAPGSCTANFTRDLTIGSSGADVLALQRFLNKSVDTRLALSGAGSPGMETQYYGSVTAAAVSKFQVKYRSEILAPSGLVNPTGYFGPSSRAKANALCNVVVIPTPNPTPTPTPSEALKGGEARLESFSADDGDDTSLSEGQDNAPVMDVEFDVEDGDVQINRIDVAVDHINGGDDDPWDVFETISIWSNGEEVASMDVDSRAAWSQNQPNSGDHRVRITNIDDLVVREGRTAEFTVALTLAGNVDDAGAVEWEMFIPDDGIRAIDSERINHFIGDTDQTVQFDIDEAGADADLAIRTSADDPHAQVLQVQRSTHSDWLTVFAFDLDADDSSEDLTINELSLTVEVSSGETYDALVRDARLVIDGEEYDDVEVSDGDTDTAILTFDFGRNGVDIDAGDVATAVLELQFSSLPEADEGTEVHAHITSSQVDAIDAEGSEDLTASQLSGSASGDTHTLRTGGTTADEPNTSATVTSVNGDNNDYATFEIELDITAFEQDVYIPTDPSLGTTWRIVDSSGNDLSGTGNATAILDSTAREQGNYFVIRDGQTETLTLQVVYVPGVANTAARLELQAVHYDSEQDATPDQTWNAAPASDYRTPVRVIVN